MKKIFLYAILLTVVFVPLMAGAEDSLVPCNGPDCDLGKLFEMLVNVYNFIVLMIATPLAVIALVVGGIFMMISAGSPDLMGKGKQIFWAAIIGLALVFGSYLIINTILSIIGFTGSWNTI